MNNLYQQIAALSPEQRALFEQRLKQRGIQREMVIPRREASSEIPLSFAQQRLWFIQQLDPVNVSYNVFSALQLQGNLNLTALQQTLDELVKRHETLRTSFTINSKKHPIQIIASPHPVPLHIIDLSDRPNPHLHAQQLALNESQQPFDLTQSLLRVTLLQLNSCHHILLITVHHIISDRWSVGVFLREMTLSYNAFAHAQLISLPELPIQYADWAIWQRQSLQGEKLETQIGYWKSQLKDLNQLELPTDRPRPNLPTYQGDQYPIVCSQALSSALKSLSNRSGTTLFTLILAAFQVLLHRYTQQDDIVVGTDIANRDRSETEGLIGLLINTLVLRTNLAGDPSFREVLERTRQVILEAIAHQDLPFEKLVEVINPDRDLRQMMPLFQVKLDLQLATVKPLQLEGLTIERLPLGSPTIKYDLRLNLQDTEQGINGQIEYSSDLFNATTISYLAQHLQTLLEGIVANPDQRISQLPILTTNEQQQQLDWQQTYRPYPTHLCIHHLFEAQVERTPEAIALIWKDQQLTYQALNAAANQMARHLQTLGVTAETKVAVCLERSLNLIITLLAILKAGGAYVPLDPAYPKERHTFILENAEATVLITQSELIHVLFDKLISDYKIICVDTDQFTNRYESHDLNVDTKENHLAYVIYTSGSTGQPKGIAIEHHSTVTLLHWAKETFSTESLAGVLASTSVCFDLSVFEIFVPLSWSGTIILAENALHLPELTAADQVTLINTVPSAIAQLLRLNAIPSSVQTVNLAGEVLHQHLVQQLYQQPQIQHVFNLYGPSEDTTYSTFARVTPEQSPPIGRPIANTQAHILDRHLNPVPIGVVGELYLSGAGLARGYLNRPELTAEKFVPMAQGRLYRTGDRARFVPDGNIQYLGRLDHQVKLRGFRIELGEIEAVLSQYPAILETAVILQESAEPSDRRIIAYVVFTESKSQTSLSHIRAFLQTKLPPYMIPASFVPLGSLPRFPNGKLDRPALPVPDGLRPLLETTYIAPSSTLEQAIATIWQQELGVEQIGLHDNFFELGGHSLLGITIIARLNDLAQVDIPLRQLFQTPTIAGLAAFIEASETFETAIAPQLPPLIPDLTQRHQPFPLTDIQQAYWIGRNEVFELGNISTHGYREIETVGLTVAQVEQALQQLIKRHDMLRMVVQPDGQQRILAEVPPYSIQTIDLSRQDLSGQESQIALLEIRDRLSHQVLPTDCYPLFNIQAILLDKKVRFCISFDVLIGDASSIQQLGQELVQLLYNPNVQLPSLTLSFRDYVLAAQQESSSHQQSREYWQQRLATLPPAPELPLAKNPAAIATPHFVRRSGELSPQLWQLLKQTAAQLNITPSGILLAAFAEVLRTWSKQPTFTLNLTLFNRLPLHPEVNQLIGDFTSSTLLAIDQSEPASFATRAQRIQAQLWQDLDHRQVSGIEVLRDLARQQQRVTGALMPVVFTSILTQSSRHSLRVHTDWAEVVYSLSQTSQVYLDHQVAEVEGALVFNWDAIEALFPVGLLDEMFAAYQNLLERLACEKELWQSSTRLLLTSATHLSNPTQRKIEPTLLHQLFFEQVALQPDRTAVITPTYTCTYQELSDRACQVAQKLQQEFNIQPNELVAVVMEKGWEQVVAVLGILAAGAAYVPIEPELPSDRRQHLLNETATRCILTQSHLKALFNSQYPSHLCIDTDFSSDSINFPLSPVLSTDLAYVIYTSGSTGLPKGVMIDHQAAVNTLLDINQRFQISNGDRLFALSSLSFDLSVYDIFGTLAAGATLVLPSTDQAKDPHHWADLLTQHQITIWNSVPALMQLLIDSQPAPAPYLRLVLLSGDWIALNLPSLICARFPSAQVISLGGATEAAIWSIFYPITEVESDWKSIPYGRSLTNQQFYVFNSALEPCPTWVTGQLYIGGAGLAQGYWRDDAKTNASFIYHPITQERLYKTGDLGRWLPDGNIEFLGREDFQVKVNGYRVELGEIEVALQQHPLIQEAVVTAIGEVQQSKQLVAYIIPNSVNKIDLKIQQRGVRQFFENQFSENQSAIVLPLSALSSSPLRRQSYRQFLDVPILVQQLGNWLSALQQFSIPDAPLPKYRYASAGSLYPVQAYLYLKPNRVESLAGFYYYQPVDHQLIPLSVKTFDAAIYGSNQAIFEQAGFALFLIAEMEAIVPIYGEQARDFCLLEAGYMSQLLMETAPDYQMGICPIGKLEFEPIQEYFQLTPSHFLVHSFVGGQIDPTWAEQWLPVAPQQPSIPERLRQYLQHQLPAYMIPTTYLLLEAFPLTANGKVDRRALPQPQMLISPHEFVAPCTETEQQLAAIWQRSLSIESISIHDNFFDLGGNSVSATQVLSQIRQTLQTELSIRQFFTTPTIAELAQILSSIRIQQPTDIIQKRDRSDLDHLDTDRLNQLSEQDVDRLLQQMLEQEAKP